MSIDTTDPAYEWVIEGLLERGERMILTGFEGIGKSALLRQIAVCSAAGIHPFTRLAMPQQRVLLVDCENHERRVTRSLGALQQAAHEHGRASADLLHAAFHPRGLDLSGADRERLVSLAAETMPDLLIIGPLYRLTLTDLHSEWAARAAVRALDEVLAKAGCAVIVEAHPGQAAPGVRRGLTPLGSSLFTRWPDYGVGLVPGDEHGTHAELRHWRGPREERAWPTALKRNPGTGFAWSADTTTPKEN